MKKLILLGLIILVIPLADAGFFDWLFGNSVMASENQPDERDIGYVIDENDILHIWNTRDDYYFNMSNGCFGQLTNHYDEYWSRNVFGIGVKTTDWNYWYSDELCDWNKYIETDNETYVRFNTTKIFDPFPNYPIGLGIIGELGLDDRMLNLTVGARNVGENDITNDIRFGWSIRDIQIQMNEEDNFFWLNNSNNLTNLSQETDLVFHNSGDNYLNIYGSGQGIDLEWEVGTDDWVIVDSTSTQYNAPVTLIIQTEGLEVGQQKQTKLRWYDACILFPGTSMLNPAISVIPILINKTPYPNNISVMGCYMAINPNPPIGQISGAEFQWQSNQTGAWFVIPNNDVISNVDCNAQTCKNVSMTGNTWDYRNIRGRQIGLNRVRCQATCNRVVKVSANIPLNVTEPVASVIGYCGTEYLGTGNWIITTNIECNKSAMYSIGGNLTMRGDIIINRNNSIFKFTNPPAYIKYDGGTIHVWN